MKRIHISYCVFSSPSRCGCKSQGREPLSYGRLRVNIGTVVHSGLANKGRTAKNTGNWRLEWRVMPSSIVAVCPSRCRGKRNGGEGACFCRCSDRALSRLVDDSQPLLSASRHHQTSLSLRQRLFSIDRIVKVFAWAIRE